ncbi:hypothetical protein FA95DRAFT_1557889 [Auriscalpium vulgare]|uniref:Uncharacterized protein n=1 Tax=Auriscalpium vulgare TaxID=40419 RepID=A0ACB8RXJ5_9AGAM|nr:hypothetical protein FA95DRAFT_1557889 [Auriscalpium vulgare]
MSLNDRELGVGKGVDVHSGVANPTTSSTHADPLASNFVRFSFSWPVTVIMLISTQVSDPTTDQVGAGASANFTGHEQAARTFKQTAGVVEGRPGIIESTNIDPLNENSNKGDGWTNATRTPGSDQRSSAGGVLSGAANAAYGAAGVASGAAKYAYGHATGDEATKQAGSEAVWGKQ